MPVLLPKTVSHLHTRATRDPRLRWHRRDDTQLTVIHKKKHKKLISLFLVFTGRISAWAYKKKSFVEFGTGRFLVLVRTLLVEGPVAGFR